DADHPDRTDARGGGVGDDVGGADPVRHGRLHQGPDRGAVERGPAHHPRPPVSAWQPCGRRLRECIDDVCRSMGACAWPPETESSIASITTALASIPGPAVTYL